MKKKNNLLFKLLLFILAIVVSFSGPLNTGIVVVIFILYVLNFIIKKNNLKDIFADNKIKFYLLFTAFLCFYSLYIGKNNSIFIGENYPIFKRYLVLPIGLYTILTQKIAWIVMLLTIVVNRVLISKKLPQKEIEKIKFYFKWISLFSIVYILLLPLGGYKSYRPNVLRYDTILPITICALFLFGKTTFVLLKNLDKSLLKVYLIFIVFVLFVYTNADKPEFEKNTCEKLMLHEISNSKSDVVLLSGSCSVLSWDKILTKESSELNAILLQQLKICNEKKLYYQK